METDMPDNMRQPVTSSAAAHAARIKARDEERANADASPVDTRQTFERYAERAAAGARADEELRQQARMGELRARGVIAAEPESEGAEDEYEEYDDEAPEDAEEDDEPVSTAERYARRERERQRAEHQATLTAHRGSTWALGEQAARLVR
jgi:hypothetical protein